jgi:hypothetical protein
VSLELEREDEKSGDVLRQHRRAGSRACDPGLFLWIGFVGLDAFFERVKRAVPERRFFSKGGSIRAMVARAEGFLVLVVVTVDAEEFPIAAVGRVVMMVVVFVMHGEFAQVFA